MSTFHLKNSKKAQVSAYVSRYTDEYAGEYTDDTQVLKSALGIQVIVFDFLVEQSRFILTGIIITFISTLIYKITPTGFKSIGKYRTKEGAILIYLGAALLLGLLTPLIYELSYLLLKEVPLLSLIGFFIVTANFIINQSVPSWRHTTPKTLLIYALGVLMIIFGVVFAFLINHD